MIWIKNYISIRDRCAWLSSDAEKHTGGIHISAKEKSRDTYLSRFFGKGIIEKVNGILIKALTVMIISNNNFRIFACSHHLHWH